MSRTFIYGLLGLAGAALAFFLYPYLLVSEKSTQCCGTTDTLFRIRDQEEQYRKAEGHYACDFKRLAEHPVTDRKDLLQRLANTGLKEGYRFGVLPGLNTSESCAYFAVPETYAVTGRRIYVMNQSSIWYRDTGNATPPAAWPSPDPVAAGWTLLE